MAAVVTSLNAVGWGVLLLVVVPQGLAVGNAGMFGAGLGVTAFLLGVRHAFDADHIAAVDNATRTLVGGGRPALSAGFWFSLGHSSVVFGLSLLLALGVRALAGPVADPDSSLRQTLGLVGAGVAGTFLLVVGLANLGSLVGIVRLLRGARSGSLDEDALEHHLHHHGVVARLLSRFTRRVAAPWHLYPVGLLMGLGLDTATQVALLVLAGGTAALSLPWYAVLVLPVLFAAGMTLFDAADGVLMARAYHWALEQPLRRVYYNLVVTSLSVVAAVGIGATVLGQLVADTIPAPGGVWGRVAGIDLEFVGFALVGVFVTVWLAGRALGRFGRLEERWARAAG